MSSWHGDWLPPTSDPRGKRWTHSILNGPTLEVIRCYLCVLLLLTQEYQEGRVCGRGFIGIILEMVCHTYIFCCYYYKWNWNTVDFCMLILNINLLDTYYPLQCSCLENPRDGEAWWASVYGVAQSQTRLKWLSSSRHLLVSIVYGLSQASYIAYNNATYKRKIISSFPLIAFLFFLAQSCSLEASIQDWISAELMSMTMYFLTLMKMPLKFHH